MNHSTPTCWMYLLRNRIIGHIFELIVQIYAVDAKRLCVRLGRPLGHWLVPRAGINRPFAGISPVSYGLSQVEIFGKLIGCRVLEVKRSERETQSQTHMLRVSAARKLAFSLATFVSYKTLTSNSCKFIIAIKKKFYEFEHQFSYIPYRQCSKWLFETKIGRFLCLNFFPE